MILFFLMLWRDYRPICFSSKYRTGGKKMAAHANPA
jgi:hypothetical protein